MRVFVAGAFSALTIAAAVAADLPVLNGDGVHDDTAAIQARLDSGVSCVYLPPPAREYLISRPLRIGSDTELRMDARTRIRLAPHSDCRMIENRDPGKGDRFISITGGVWDFNNVNQSPNPGRRQFCDPPLPPLENPPKRYDPKNYLGIAMYFGNVRNLQIRGVTVKDPTTYAMSLWKVSDFLVDDITFDFPNVNPVKANMDGVHLDGFCHHGRISNIRGTCFDDTIALNAVDGYCSAGEGPVTDIDIDGVYAEYGHSAVRLLSAGPHAPVRNITIRNIHGSFYRYTVGLTHFFSPRSTRGVMDGIVIENCFGSTAPRPQEKCQPITPFPVVFIEGRIDYGDITVRGLKRDESATYEPAIGVQTGAKIARLKIEDCSQVNRMEKPLVFLRNDGEIGKLEYDPPYFVSAPGTNIPYTRDKFKYVDVFTGTAATGHTHPGAAYPFGMVQAGPDTGTNDWRYCSGYQFADRSVLGYSMNHLSGTGCPDYGDLRILPFTGDVRPMPMRSAIDKSTEAAEPGFYRVYQPDDGVLTEVTAVRRGACYRFTWKKEGTRRVLVDLASCIGYAGEANATGYRTEFEGRNTLLGEFRRHGWVGDRPVAFMLKFNRDWTACEKLPPDADGQAPRFVFSFDLPVDEPVSAEIALSMGGGLDGARRNFAAEMVHEGAYEEYKWRTRETWNRIFDRFDMEGTETEKRNFYTAVYHLFFQPNDWSDAGERPFLTTLSLWDTFRAAQPLYTIVAPEIVAPCIESILRVQRKTGRLPVMSYGGNNVDCMIGNHAVPVIADAYLKRDFDGLGDVKKLDWSEIYAAVRDTLVNGHSGKPKEDWDAYSRYGYFPCDLIRGESVSRTLECSYDDWCAGVLARELGHADDAKMFFARAGNWKNVFDASLGLARGKDSKGAWREPFDPYLYGHGADTPNDFTEGNAFQYSWHVLHDVDGLVGMMGGKTGFLKRLDSLFVQPKTTEGEGLLCDITGLIGQYVHGNEPSHHVIYFYPQLGEPDKAAERIRDVFDRFYMPGPEGLCGNDDCGQMSAWYLFSAMGFYPFNPCGGEYVIGAPQLPRVEMKVGGGERRFTVIAKNLSHENKYVKSVTLNGRPITDWKIRHADIVAGGELVFEMTNRVGRPVSPP